MKMDYKVILNCFHGTIKHYSDEIMTEHNFTFKQRNDHWLGNGVYFFINDKSKAEWWSREASSLAKRDRELNQISADTTGKVVYLETTLSNSELLDLDTEAGQKKLSDFIKHLKKMGFSITRKVSGSVTEHQARCELLDLLIGTEDFKACSYTFDSNHSEIYKGIKEYGIINRNRQLSVYDQTIIDFDTLIVL